ncbi:hypothetical protein SAMN05421850_109125 [Lutimaribacter saemankumensis]|uniref:Uncharacterized protein n=1 Tax=Lutimaribacter saemankumensis TaxID=490829 RepID=A0A1G8RHM1_9RHOB|nr:hypothetical protein SAMN05421850_109125 [Lutimaribacter saemankumensis]
MKNPNSASGVGAFRVTSTATLNSSVDAMKGLTHATKNEQRFRWCDRSNSVQPLRIRKGEIEHG